MPIDVIDNWIIVLPSKLRELSFIIGGVWTHDFRVSYKIVNLDSLNLKKKERKKENIGNSDKNASNAQPSGKSPFANELIVSNYVP